MLTYDEHQELLNELAGEEPIERSRLVEIAGNLRDNYAETTKSFEENTSKLDGLQKENYDLVVSNSQMFRQLGSQNSSEESKKKEQEKSFSESITIEDVERNVK